MVGVADVAAVVDAATVRVAATRAVENAVAALTFLGRTSALCAYSVAPKAIGLRVLPSRPPDVVTTMDNQAQSSLKSRDSDMNSEWRPWPSNRPQ